MNELLLRDPLWLLALLPLLLLVVWSVRRHRRHAARYSSGLLLQGLPATFAQRLKRLLPVVALAGFVCCALALARPQHGEEEFRIDTEGIAIQIALDRSGSMDAMDFEMGRSAARRIKVARQVTRDFVAGRDELAGRPNDMVGLVAFGGFAQSLCPLTLDHGALLAVLDTVDTPKPLVDENGRVLNQALLEEESSTAIGDAVALCVERLSGVEAESKVLILLSDGENTAGIVDPMAAAEAAAEFGIKLYAIGIGSTGWAPFETVDIFGRPQIRERPVRLDERLLREMAEVTGGRYYNARHTEALKDVYAEIDELEKTEIEGRLYTQYRELYQLLLIPGLLLLLIHAGLRSTRFRTLP